MQKNKSLLTDGHYSQKYKRSASGNSENVVHPCHSAFYVSTIVLNENMLHPLERGKNFIHKPGNPHFESLLPMP